MNPLVRMGYPRLADAGYVCEDGVKAPGSDNTIRDPDQLDKLEGRLSNIDYMARAIDLFDGIETDIAGTQSGQEQFDHLINTPHLVWTGYLYVALRRLQRNNQNAGLRAGLALLLASDQGLVAARDVVEAMAPDLVQKEDLRDDDSEKRLLDRAAQRALPEMDWDKA